MTMRLAVRCSPTSRHLITRFPDGTAPWATQSRRARRRSSPARRQCRVHAGPGAHLDDVVGGANRVLIVLDDDHRVADVAQPRERADHLHVVLGMQTDARSSSTVEHPISPEPICVDSRMRWDSPPDSVPERRLKFRRSRPTAEQQLEPVANLAEHLRTASAPRPSASTSRGTRAARRSEGGRRRGWSCRDGEQQPRRTHARAIAIGAGVLDHALSSHASMPEFASPRCR